MNLSRTACWRKGKDRAPRSTSSNATPQQFDTSTGVLTFRADLKFLHIVCEVTLQGLNSFNPAQIFVIPELTDLKMPNWGRGQMSKGLGKESRNADN